MILLSRRTVPIRIKLTLITPQSGAANPQDDSGNNADDPGVWEASNSFVNMLASGSVADTFGLGVEIQLSTVVHHSGAWIEYDYEQETGHLVAMRRSDGTVLELKWHNRISRLLSIWVKNEETHPGEEPSGWHPITMMAKAAC